MSLFFYEAGPDYAQQNTVERAIYRPSGNISQFCSCNQFGIAIPVGNGNNLTYQAPVQFMYTYAQPTYLLYSNPPYNPLNTFEIVGAYNNNSQTGG